MKTAIWHLVLLTAITLLLCACDGSLRAGKNNDQNYRQLALENQLLQQQLNQRKQQIAQLGIGDDLQCYENVSEADLVMFYNLADLLVFPSLYEGFGLPPLEAMSCGTPVVCSGAGAIPEVVGDAAMIVDPMDEDALAAAVERVLSDSETAAELVARGRARAKMFTWEHTACETLSLYEQVVARPGRCIGGPGCQDPKDAVLGVPG